MDYEAALSGYTPSAFQSGDWTRTVYRRGEGPAVIIIHEMPGLHPLVIRFADRVAAAGMTVFLPSLFGTPGKPVSIGYAIGTMLKTICIAREFNLWANGRSSPIVEWLRALARSAHAECGGRGVGAAGMCFTGGYALAMMTEPAVVAPVLSQPSNPILGKGKEHKTDASPAEIACAKQRMANEDLSMIGLRFFGDKFVPDGRFEFYKREFGQRFEAIEIDPKHAKPAPGGMAHSVLTLNLRDQPGEPTKLAEERVIAFFKERTGA